MKKGEIEREFGLKQRYSNVMNYHCPCCPNRFSMQPCTSYFQGQIPSYNRFLPPFSSNNLNQESNSEIMIRNRELSSFVKLQEQQNAMAPLKFEPTSIFQNQFRFFKDNSMPKIKPYRTKSDPLPSVSFKAKYFDPAVAPTMTSPDYAKIQNGKEHKPPKFTNPKQLAYYSETQHPEEDSNYFIVYKYRRIKKKYRKYMKARGMTGDFLDERSDIEEQDEEDEESAKGESVNQELSIVSSNKSSRRALEQNKNFGQKTIEELEQEQKQKLQKLVNNDFCQF